MGRTAANSPRKTQPRSRAVTKARRAEIVEAAIKVFSRRGFEAARAEDIAQAAKIAKGTLYLYFRSKEALYTAAIAQALAEVLALSTERINAAQNFREKLETAVSVRLHFWAEREMLYRLLITLGRTARHRRQTNELASATQGQLLAIFEEGMARGQLAPADYAPLAWAVLDLLRGSVERRIDRASTSSVEEDTETITRFVMRASGAL